jgi:hypothetical protein
MSRAFVFPAFAVAALASLVLMLSDSRGDAPPQKSKSAAAAKSGSKASSRPKSKPDKSDVPESGGASGEAKIEAELDKPIDMEYQDTPLKDIVDSLSSRLGIAIVLDNKALADASVTPDTTFTKTIRGIPLRSALHLLLADHDLNSYVDHDVLLITTNDIAKAHTVTRVYDVGAFAETAESVKWQRTYNAPTAGCIGCIAQGAPSQSTTPQKIKATVPSARVRTPTNSATASSTAPATGRMPYNMSAGEFDYDSIIEVITTTIAPTSWDSEGGVGSIAPFGGKLVILQTEEVQRQVAELLEAIKPQATPVPLSLSGPPVTSRYEAKIEDALDHPTDLEFVNTPLKDIADLLSSRLGITIVLDNRSLADASITPDTTFTKTLRGISLRQALRLLLADHDMSFVVRDDVLMLTTNDIAKTTTHVVIYPVGELVGDGDYDSLIETITSIVAPSSWDSNGGPGSIAPFPRSKCLPINQTEEVHRQIKDLLMKLLPSRPPAAKVSAAKPTPAKPTSPADDKPVLQAYSVRGWVADDKNLQRGAIQFVEMTKKLVEPKSWNQPDVFIGLTGDTVVVRQKPAVQREIQKLIDVLVNPSVTAQQMPMGGGMGGGFDGGGMGGGFGGGVGPPTH